MTYDRAFHIDRARKWASTFARHENESARFFVRGDERAEEICWNAPAAPANTRRSPGNCFAQNIFTIESRREPRRKCKRQIDRRIAVRWSIEFFPGKPDFDFHCPQNFRRKIEEGSDAD